MKTGNNEDKVFVSTMLHSKSNGKDRGCSIQLTLLEIEKNFEYLKGRIVKEQKLQAEVS